MSNVLDAELRKIERETGVHVIADAEYGSTATGLDGPNSDLDVMFVYLNAHSRHVAGNQPDTITRTSDTEDIELTGWSLEKFVGSDSGILSSNPSVMEFINSPSRRTFSERVDGFEQLCRYAESEFKPLALIKHYNSFATSNHHRYLKDRYKLAEDATWADIRELSPPSLPDPPRFGVDEEESFIGPNETTIAYRATETRESTIPTRAAVEAGYLVRAASDRTPKRALTVIDALLRSLYVEFEHELPPANFDELQESVGVLMDGDIPGPKIDHLKEAKRTGDGDEISYHIPVNWIESKLDRTFAYDDHVDRTPYSETVDDWVERIVQSIAYGVQ
ncbi:DNA polymerase beta superfamily protein [Halosegnis longus]|uniref:DNA polymerase beta superfamily protein n=1 Tax=Halosegnis longus TaxID=2216012 RepID=UPI00129DB9F7|nr:nucleotidyltransferase domain-containing protein [Halosegnis longus]